MLPLNSPIRQSMLEVLEPRAPAAVGVGVRIFNSCDPAWEIAQVRMVFRVFSCIAPECTRIQSAAFLWEQERWECRGHRLPFFSVNPRKRRSSYPKWSWGRCGKGGLGACCHG